MLKSEIQKEKQASIIRAILDKFNFFPELERRKAEYELNITAIHFVRLKL